MSSAKPNPSKKICQPAIAGESVTTIRKYLQRTRLLWENRHDDTGDNFDLNADLAAQEDRTYHMQQFCLDFVRGNHAKRCKRGRTRTVRKAEQTNSPASD